MRRLYFVIFLLFFSFLSTNYVFAQVAEETAIEEAAIEEAAIEEAAIEEAAIEEAAIEETAIEETAIEETAIEETAIEETAIEETAIEETAIEETAIKETTGKLPAEISDKKSNLAEKALESSGINLQLETFPRFIGQGFYATQKNKDQFSTAVFRDLLKIIESSFYPGKLQLGLRKTIESNLDEEEMVYLLEWFDSPLGKTITNLEIESASPASMQRMKAIKNQLLRTRYGPERLEKIGRLNRAIEATETAVDMALNMEMALSMTIAGTSASASDEVFNSIMNQVLKKRPELESKMADQASLTFLYTYRVLKNSEIDAYITFAESNYGKKFRNIISTALTNELASAGREAGKAIGQYLKTKGIR